MDRSLRFDIKIIQNPFILEGIDLSDYIHAVSGTAVSPTTYNKIWRKSVAELMFKTLQQGEKSIGLFLQEMALALINL